MVIAKEAAIGAQRRRMRRRQHEMPGAVNHAALAHGIAAPQDEDQMLPVGGKVGYHLVGEELPAVVLMRAGTVSLDGERGVEQ